MGVPFAAADMALEPNTVMPRMDVEVKLRTLAVIVRVLFELVSAHPIPNVLVGSFGLTFTCSIVPTGHNDVPVDVPSLVK